MLMLVCRGVPMIQPEASGMAGDLELEDSDNSVILLCTSRGPELPYKEGETL